MFEIYEPFLGHYTLHTFPMTFHDEMMYGFFGQEGLTKGDPHSKGSNIMKKSGACSRKFLEMRSVAKNLQVGKGCPIGDRMSLLNLI